LAVTSIKFSLFGAVRDRADPGPMLFVDVAGEGMAGLVIMAVKVENEHLVRYLSCG
jgi:hypothetical protein